VVSGSLDSAAAVCGLCLFAAQGELAGERALCAAPRDLLLIGVTGWLARRH